MTKKKEKEDDPYGDRLQAIWDRVEKTIGIDCEVIYSAYETDDIGPVDNLDEVAIEGKVLLRSEPDHYGDGVKIWKSPILENPTWMEITIQANAMMLATKDGHHCFLEGFNIKGTRDGVKIAILSMGS